MTQPAHRSTAPANARATAPLTGGLIDAFLGKAASIGASVRDSGATYWDKALDKAADLLGSADRSSPGQPQSGHYYATRNQTIPCRVTNDQIRDMARRFAVPGQGGIPFVDGKKTSAIVAGKTDPVNANLYRYGDYPTGVVTTVNHTLPEHVFHKGDVDRQWFRAPNGTVWTQTVGRGANSGPGIAGLNGFSGPKIFDNLDAEARDYALRKLCGG